MARKRGLFFHPIFSFLRNLQIQIKRQWTQLSPIKRRWPRAVYGLLVIVTLISAMVAPGLAKGIYERTTINRALIDIMPEEAIAQTSAQTSPEPAEAPQCGQAPQCEQEARAAYHAGQFGDAAAAFETAARLYQQSGQPDQAKESQINQARALQALGLYSRAIMVLQAVLQTPKPPTLLLEDLSRIQHAIQNSNQNENANKRMCEIQEPNEIYWDGAIQKRLGVIPTSPTTVFALRSLGDALQIAGDLEQSQILLQHSLELAKALDLTNSLAPTYLSLGNLARTQAIANLKLNNMTSDQAIAQLQQQKDLSPMQQVLQCRRTVAAQAFISRTNKALDYYQQAANPDINSPLIQAQARLNSLSLRLDRQQWSDAAPDTPMLYPLLDSLPPSRATVYAHINLAQSLMRLSENSSELADPLSQAAQLLATAQQQASDLGVPQTESYVLGELGALYERTNQWSEAKAFTQQALQKTNGVSATSIPLTVNDTDLAYRWYRQLGTILKAEGDREAAIAAYENAVSILQTQLSLDVASSNLNYKVSFRQETQEPVYKEFMELMLEEDEPSQPDLQQVRELSSSLLKDELTSFLQEPCTVPTATQIDGIINREATDTAVIYPIIFADRLEVIVKLPGDPELLHYRQTFSELDQPLTQDQFLDNIANLKLALEEDYTFEAVKTRSKRLYDLIVKPAEAKLEEKNIKTLVFTLDNQLQPIPMAALYDGEKYLIEKYATAEFLGLSIASEPSQSQGLSIIAAGVSSVPDQLPTRVQNQFQPLENVEKELDKISELEKTGEGDDISVTTLLNEDFTLTNFNRRLNEDSFQVVHLATHGQFSFNPEETFLLVNDKTDMLPEETAPLDIATKESDPDDAATNGDLTDPNLQENGMTDTTPEEEAMADPLVEVEELAALFRRRGRIRPEAIELLVLNACETAAGDSLATLGLAGAAVRAGANSAIASLWTLEDAPSVDFSELLYENLRQGFSKAEALRRVQLELLQNPKYQQYHHPRYWAPYILAGNWLPLTASTTSS